MTTSNFIKRNLLVTILFSIITFLIFDIGKLSNLSFSLLPYVGLSIGLLVAYGNCIWPSITINMFIKNFLVHGFYYNDYGSVKVIIIAAILTLPQLIQVVAGVYVFNKYSVHDKEQFRLTRPVFASVFVSSLLAFATIAILVSFTTAYPPVLVLKIATRTWIYALVLSVLVIPVVLITIAGDKYTFYNIKRKQLTLTALASVLACTAISLFMIEEENSKDISKKMTMTNEKIHEKLVSQLKSYAFTIESLLALHESSDSVDPSEFISFTDRLVFNMKHINCFRYYDYKKNKNTISLPEEKSCATPENSLIKAAGNTVSSKLKNKNSSLIIYSTASNKMGNKIGLISMDINMDSLFSELLGGVNHDNLSYSLTANGSDTPIALSVATSYGNAKITPFTETLKFNIFGNKFQQKITGGSILWFSNSMAHNWVILFILSSLSLLLTYVALALAARDANLSLILDEKSFEVTKRKNTERLLQELNLDLENQVHKRTRELQEQNLRSIKSAKMASLGEMAGGIAHEINNPLTIISGSADLISHMIEKNDLQEDLLLKSVNKIDATVKRIASIITGLRTFARDGSEDELESIQLNDFIKDSLSFCNERFKNNGVKLSVDSIADDQPIFGKRIELSQVLINLLNNSFDAIKNQSEKWVKITFATDVNFLYIRITDSGVGIEDHVADKVMNPFFTTKTIGEGTGLGLSISKGIIESHGGSLLIDRNSKNTCFVISLPIQERQKAAS